MKIHDIYDYLVRARRSLWSTLRGVPDEVLSRHVLNGSQFHCIKDLLGHIPAVEDGWLHEDILRADTVWSTMPTLAAVGDSFADVPLAVLLDYWQSVERSTLEYLASLSEPELKRVVTVHDAPDDRFTVDAILWHFLIHEMRHTAQIAMLLRMQGIAPPSLDLLFYMPSA